MLSTHTLLGTLGLFGLVAAASGCVISSVKDNDVDGIGGRSSTGGTSSGGSATTGGDAGASTGGGAGEGTGGSSGAYFSLSSVTINGSARTGSVQLSGQLGIAEGEVAFVLSSIKDPEDASRPVDPATVAFNVTLDGTAMECEVGPTNELQMAPVDVVFLNDTTGSMEESVNGIADSVAAFATSIAERGIDAQFAMLTYGDEFSTMTDGEDAFTVGQAEWVSSSVDANSRAYVGLTDLSTFEAFLAEVQASGDLGQGGGDGPENTLGVLAYALENLSWRSGAARVLVAIGDNPAHTVASITGLSWAEQYVPPEVDALLASLDGTAVVHVVGHDSGSGDLYNLKGLSDATGGAFIELPTGGVVDLTGTALNNWVGSTWFGVCFGATPGANRELEIAATVTGAAEHTGEVTYDITLE